MHRDQGVQELTAPLAGDRQRRRTVAVMMLAVANRFRGWLQHSATAVAAVTSGPRAYEDPRRRTPLPTGTLTLLFSDLEGSTRLLERLGDDFSDVLDEHRRIVRHAVGEHDGHEVRTAGDGFFVVFACAANALRAVVAVQRAHAWTAWPDGLSVRVRMGLHTGKARVAEEDYFGLDVHRAARICAVAHGGQVLVSETTIRALAGQVIEGVRLRDLGEHWLRDLSCPLRLHQVVADGLFGSLWPAQDLTGHQHARERLRPARQRDGLGHRSGALVRTDLLVASASPRWGHGCGSLVGGVAEARPVAEAPQLDPHGRTVRAILVRGQIAHVRAPAARIDSALEPRALPAPDRRRILIAILARARGIRRKQALAARVGAGPVEYQRARPALAQGVQEVAANLGVLRRAEGDVLYGNRAYEAAWARARRRLRGAPSPGIAGLRARARQRLAVDAVVVGVAGVAGVLGGGLVGVCAARRRLRGLTVDRAHQRKHDDQKDDENLLREPLASHRHDGGRW
jgi:class 3 adenylate cyclase